LAINVGCDSPRIVPSSEHSALNNSWEHYRPASHMTSVWSGIYLDSLPHKWNCWQRSTCFRAPKSIRGVLLMLANDSGMFGESLVLRYAGHAHNLCFFVTSYLIFNVNVIILSPAKYNFKFCIQQFYFYIRYTI
jgi:hypothetical protein